VQHHWFYQWILSLSVTPQTLDSQTRFSRRQAPVGGNIPNLQSDMAQGRLGAARGNRRARTWRRSHAPSLQQVRGGGSWSLVPGLLNSPPILGVKRTEREMQLTVQACTPAKVYHLYAEVPGSNIDKGTDCSS
jgi:hypothetical protein